MQKSGRHSQSFIVCVCIITSKHIHLFIHSINYLPGRWSNLERGNTTAMADRQKEQRERQKEREKERQSRERERKREIEICSEGVICRLTTRGKALRKTQTNKKELMLIWPIKTGLF